MPGKGPVAGNTTVLPVAPPPDDLKADLKAFANALETVLSPKKLPPKVMARPKDSPVPAPSSLPTKKAMVWDPDILGSPTIRKTPIDIIGSVTAKPALSSDEPVIKERSLEYEIQSLSALLADTNHALTMSWEELNAAQSANEAIRAESESFQRQLLMAESTTKELRDEFASLEESSKVKERTLEAALADTTTTVTRTRNDLAAALTANDTLRALVSQLREVETPSPQRAPSQPVDHPLDLDTLGMASALLHRTRLITLRTAQLHEKDAEIDALHASLKTATEDVGRAESEAKALWAQNRSLVRRVVELEIEQAPRGLDDALVAAALVTCHDVSSSGMLAAHASLCHRAADTATLRCALSGSIALCKELETHCVASNKRGEGYEKAYLAAKRVAEQAPYQQYSAVRQIMDVIESVIHASE